MNVVILMAGASAGFLEAGYMFPKSLVEIDAKPIVQHVVGKVMPVLGPKDRLIVLVRHDENMRFHIGAVIKLLAQDAEIIEVRGETSGAACTALLTVDRIDNEEELLLLNGDQLLDMDMNAPLHDFRARRLDGGIVVFEDVHPRWSFVKCDQDGHVIEAAEKRPISNRATAGCYYFKAGRDFVAAAQSMILKNAAVNGAFYVCPAYNELVLRNRRIGVHLIDKSEYISLSTPQNIRAYEQSLKEARPQR